MSKWTYDPEAIYIHWDENVVQFISEYAKHYGNPHPNDHVHLFCKYKGVIPSQIPPYSVGFTQRAALDNKFSYHAPIPGQLERYVLLRAKARELAELVMESTPESREQSIALTDIENAVMWANAAIARNEKS